MDALAVTPYLLHLLDPGEGGEALGRLSPEVVKARTFEALRELSRRLAGRAPLVIVVEDLHWVDRTSEEYLGDARRRRRGRADPPRHHSPAGIPAAVDGPVLRDPGCAPAAVGARRA